MQLLGDRRQPIGRIGGGSPSVFTSVQDDVRSRAEAADYEKPDHSW